MMSEACKCIVWVHMCPQRSEKGTESFGIGVTGYNLSGGCWETNWFPTKEQQVPFSLSIFKNFSYNKVLRLLKDHNM